MSKFSSTMNNPVGCTSNQAENMTVATVRPKYYSGAESKSQRRRRRHRSRSLGPATPRESSYKQLVAYFCSSWNKSCTARHIVNYLLEVVSDDSARAALTRALQKNGRVIGYPWPLLHKQILSWLDCGLLVPDDLFHFNMSWSREVTDEMASDAEITYLLSAIYCGAKRKGLDPLKVLCRHSRMWYGYGKPWNMVAIIETVKRGPVTISMLQNAHKAILAHQQVSHGEPSRKRHRGNGGMFKRKQGGGGGGCFEVVGNEDDDKDGVEGEGEGEDDEDEDDDLDTSVVSVVCGRGAPASADNGGTSGKLE